MNYINIIRGKLYFCDYPPWRLLLTATVLTLVSYFPVGFHHCVLNVSHDIFQQLINESYIARYSDGGEGLDREKLASLWSTTVSSWQFGGVFGSMNAFWLADKMGRKITLTLIAGCLQTSAGICMILALEYRYFELLILGRLLSGIGTGVVSIVLRVFIGECSPDRYRETPKFLYLSRNDKKKAEASVIYFHEKQADQKAVFDELEEERQLAGDKLTFLRALRLESVRLPLILSMMAGICDCATGADLIDNYSAEIYKKLGLPDWEAQLCSILMNVSAVIGAALSSVLIDRCHRRTLLPSTLIASFVFNTLIIIIGGIAKFGLRNDRPGVGYGITAAVIISAMQLAYCLGPGAILEPMFAEVSPHRVRAVAGSISEISNSAVKALFIFLYPIVNAYAGTITFLIHTIPLGLCIAYFYYRLPETSKQSVAHIICAIISKKSGSIKSTEEKIDEKKSASTIAQGNEGQDEIGGEIGEQETAKQDENVR